MRSIGTIVVLAVAGALAGPAAAADYSGKAQALAPLLKEIGYTHLLRFQPAKAPPAALATGYKEGVAAIYHKGTTKAPIEAVATIYVYATAAAAKLAWQHACPTCTGHVVTQGVQMKFVGVTQAGVLTFTNVTTCRNIYVAVVTAGSESASKLANDAGSIAGRTYVRAIHSGMSACTAK